MTGRIIALWTLGAVLVPPSVLAADNRKSTIDDTKARLTAAAGQTFDADAVIVLDETNVLVRPSGIGETTMRKVVKLLREGAIRGQAVQRFDYDPTTNRLSIDAVRVVRADGRVEEVDPASAAEHPAPQWGIYWGSRQRCIGLPRLEIGDAIETIETKIGYNVAYLREGSGFGVQGSGPADEPQAGPGESKNQNPKSKITSDDAAADLVPPMPGHWYDEVSFWSGLPVIEKRYTVRIPRDKQLQYGIYNGELTSSVTFDGDHIVYSFEKKNIPVFKSEPNMVSASDVACKLVLATLGDWLEKSRWFHQANEHAFAVDDEIKAKVAEVTRDCKDDESKITALNHWVAENIRYIGTSRGCREGFTTHDAIETFRDRGGVCKDKAGLLVAMLRVAGFDSYIVMTMAGQEVWPVPADQFNHAVSSIRNKDGTLRLLDPTWMPKSRDNWSSWESLQHVVYGTPEGVALSRSPYSPPESNHVSWKLESRIADTGQLTAALAVTAQGGPETSLRRAFAGRGPQDRDRTLDDSLVRLAANVERETCAIMDPVDFAGPYRVECRVTVPHFAIGDDGRRMFALPALRNVLGDHALGDVWGTNGPDKRQYTMRIRTTRKASFEETLHFPETWAIESAPEAVTLDGPAAALTFAPQRSAGKFSYRCELTLKKHRVPPEEYGQYKQVLDAFEKLAGGAVVCKAEAARVQR